jgi:lactam utilization protein B
MAAMAEGMRGDLGQVTKAHAGLYQQLQEQSAKVDEVSAGVKRVETAVERVTALESQVAALGRWVKVGVSLIVVLLVAVILLLARK